jgi:hypothetical protein
MFTPAMRTVCSILDLNDIKHDNDKEISIFDDKMILGEKDIGFNPLGY